MKMKKRLIDETRLTTLLEAEATLEALENAGVDNWCGYGEAFKPELNNNMEWDNYKNMVVDEELKAFPEVDII